MAKVFRLCLSAFAAVVLFACAACTDTDKTYRSESNDNGYQKIRMVMTTPGTENGVDTLIARRIADEVNKDSNGNVTIEVYDNDRLAGGNTTQGVRLISDGSVDIAVYSSGTLSKLDYRLAIGTLPWTFYSYKHARTVIDETGGAYYEKILAEQGLRYLGSAHNGMRQISNNKRPVVTPDDLAGLRIRVLGNEVSRLFFQTFDALAVPMSRSEIIGALEQDIIDGHDIGFSQLSSLKLHDFQMVYMTELNYSYDNHIFVANSKTFDRLDEKTQALIREKTREACEWGRDYVESRDEYLKNEFVQHGVILTRLSAEELDAFKQKFAPTKEMLIQKYGEEACRAFQISYDKGHL